MKIVVIGGSRLIGRQLVAILGEQGHEASAAAPSTGADMPSDAGIAEPLTGE
jgi:uncharacterized protein YbjT (DUF2867 family)